MKIKKYQNPSDVLENNSNVTTTKPVLDNIQYDEDGVMRWKDQYGNEWPLYQISNYEYVSLDTEGNISHKFNIDPEAVSKLKRYDAKDLDNFFANLLTFGAANELTEGAKHIDKGEYLDALKNYANIAVFGPGALGNIIRAGYGAYHLLDENGIPKTFGLALGTRNDGLTGNRFLDTTLSLGGDFLNGTLAYSGGNGIIENLAQNGNRWTKGYMVGKALNGDINATKLGQQNPYLAWGAPVAFGKTAKVPRITVENMAEKSTDSWESAYSRVLNSGDVAEQQRLIDLRWNVDAPNSKIKIGNSPLKLSHSTDSNFNTFDSKYWKYGAVGEGNYFGPEGSNFAKLPIVKKFYVNQEQPLFLNDVEREALFEDTTTMPKDIQASGYDGVVVNYGNTPFSDFELVGYFPNRIKLADPVTYDNNGWTIPITERFHFEPKDVDIRGRGWFGESIAQQNAQAMRQSSKILEAKGIGEANPQTVVRPMQGHVSLQNPKNPLQIRHRRLESKFTGDYDSSTQKLLNRPIVRINEIRKAFQKLDPTLTDDELDLAAQTAFANRRGVHIPIGNNSGKTIGGVSVVDIKETLKYLRESGIINPNAEDVGTVVAHELGHGVKVNKAAMNLVKDYSNPNEFYTLVGQILDYGKVTKNEEISFNRLMKLTDKYLHNKKLDNGITELREYLSNYPMSQRKDLMKAIGRFSAGLFGTYLMGQGIK